MTFRTSFLNHLYSLKADGRSQGYLNTYGYKKKLISFVSSENHLFETVWDDTYILLNFTETYQSYKTVQTQRSTIQANGLIQKHIARM